MNTNLKKTVRIVLLLALGAGIFLLGRCSVARDDAPRPETGPTAESDSGPTVWTCPMHSQIKLPDPGDCPICGMDLVPLSSGEDEGPRRLAMSAEARRLAGIRTTPVERRFVTRPVRMVGKIDFDETAVRTISAWVPGRLDRLFVDYTGVSVKKGDHLVWLYSPDLLTAQEELLSAKKRLAATAGEASEFLAQSNQRAYRSARDKLLLWGLTEPQLDEIESRGTAEDHVMLTSPASGVVIRKELDEGAYVQTGTPIYGIADLGRLWVQLDAYEQDLPWLRYAQHVAMQAEALPGEVFHGTITFVDPVIHERTRTAKVRLNIDNSDGRLKPGMFVRAVVEARLGENGILVDRSLAGKWVSPMHPEVIRDGPGPCDVCGMPLVPAEELGLVTAADAARKPLVVPSSAVLVTGKRAVVYVEVLQAERPTFEGREVVLGPRAGDDYIVRSGLEEGEPVVVNGAFRIDSSMQIRAKPSMMSAPGEGESWRGLEAATFRASLQPVFEGYLELQAALYEDDFAKAGEAARRAASAASGAAPASLPAGGRSAWSEERPGFERALAAAAAAEDVEALRAAFHDLSKSLLALERVFGHSAEESYFEVFCPMAFEGDGGAWLQRDSEVRNPYYGPAMPRCGDVRRELPGGAVDAAREPAGDGRGHDHGGH